MSWLKQAYAKYFFAPLMDRSLRQPMIEELRAKLVAQAEGDVLEIGYGTGLNLPHYTSKVERLTLVDPVELLPRRVAQRIADCQAERVQRLPAAAEQLPVEDATQDFVISTFTLCSVADVNTALAEARRVLKPGGKLLVLEHGRSDEASIARWQDRLNGLQRLLACGCNLNRPMAQLIAAGGLTFASLDRFTLRQVPRVMGSMYLGVAHA